MAKATGTKTFILQLKNGNTRKITIPDNWKMTFGQLVPYTDRGTRHENGGVALRLYEGNKENLRAVMTDVVSIRDASIQMMEKRTQTKRQTVQKKTQQGTKDVTLEARVTEWVNPDKDEDEAVPEEFLRLPKAEDEREIF